MVDLRKDAIKACMDCHLVCQEVLAYHGDRGGGTQLSSQHIKRLMACIEICQTTANLLTIRAPLTDQLAELCAHICEQCATSCKASGHEALQRCVAACQVCARACFEESHHIKKAA